ncbi:MAG: hypothetical protein J3K34DRAFT_525340 [Monoraphidium minutum]|nr:MAG: hypothetical protein J3K34DRAFT_525340 [Monoraphidium minutum]
MITHLLSAFSRARSVPSKGWKVLTSKQYKRMYKGKGSMKTGVHTRYGGFTPLPAMLPRYLAPDLEGFTLKPYVANYPEQSQRGAAGEGGEGGGGGDAGAAAGGGGAGGGSGGAAP